MAKAAVLGYGTVGSGVVEVLETNADIIKGNAGEPIEVKYILDLREFPGDPHESAIVHDFAVIEADPEVTVVAEAMGGLHPAYEFTKRLLTAGKSVATSNKELVAEFGAELTKVAAEHGVSYLYEASCGGGIPIIRPLRNAITADYVTSIGGIFNGTTNYILSKMETEGESYETVLAKAQAHGYAERNPAADVEGYDTCRKLAILAGLAYGVQIDYRDIRTEGITKITEEDIRFASFLGYRIKLLGRSLRTEKGIYATVVPAMVRQESPLFGVNGVFNGIVVHGNMLGDVMFYGRGAGKKATGSAVVSDLVEEVRMKGKCGVSVPEEKVSLLAPENLEYRYFVRMKKDPAQEELVYARFEEAAFAELADLPEECGFVTEKMSERIFLAKMETLSGILSWIRIPED